MTESGCRALKKTPPSKTERPGRTPSKTEGLGTRSPTIMNIEQAQEKIDANETRDWSGWLKDLKEPIPESTPLPDKEPRMYDYCFKTCLATVAVATLLGVAAVWAPDAWYEVGTKLLWTDIVLFVGALAGALLSHVGASKNTSQYTAREIEIGNAIRRDIKQGQIRLLKETE